MSGEVDLLAVLAETCRTNDPIGLLQALEQAGLHVAVRDVYDPVAHRAAMQEFGQTLEPIWEQGNATRLRLGQDGWSDEMAEHLASHVVHLMLDLVAQQLFSQGGANHGASE